MPEGIKGINREEQTRLLFEVPKDMIKFWDEADEEFATKINEAYIARVKSETEEKKTLVPVDITLDALKKQLPYMYIYAYKRAELI